MKKIWQHTQPASSILAAYIVPYTTAPVIAYKTAPISKSSLQTRTLNDMSIFLTGVVNFSMNVKPALIFDVEVDGEVLDDNVVVVPSVDFSSGMFAVVDLPVVGVVVVVDDVVADCVEKAGK